MESIAPLAALRPQPFGLPLRGRAPHSEGGNRSRRWQPVIDHKKMGADSLLILPLSGRRMGGSAYEDGKEVTLKDGQTIEMMVGGESTRYFWDDGKWVLEEGDFSRNAGCNLRVRFAFQELGAPLPGIRV